MDFESLKYCMGHKARFSAHAFHEMFGRDEYSLHPKTQNDVMKLLVITNHRSNFIRNLSLHLLTSTNVKKMSERNHSKTNNEGPEHDYLSLMEISVSTFSVVISAQWLSCKNYVSV